MKTTAVRRPSSSLDSNKKTAAKSTTNVAKPKSTTSSASAKRVTVDIVTGKELVSVYFDTSKAIGFDNTKEADWVGLNFYAPASVIKEENGILTVKLPGGEVFKVSDGVKVSDLDDEGVDDILKLRDFSEMSLIHTLRVRYSRDDIYTFVGPILISINPYKHIKGMYDDVAMEKYHGKKQVRYFLF